MSVTVEMRVTVENVYPSTDDCAMTLLPKTDAVLECLVNARQRYVAAPVQNAYIEGEGAYMEVCAIGAVFAADGFTADDMHNSESDANAVYELVDKELSDEAKTAIRLLNEAATELYPGVDEEKWSGPLETINQSLEPAEFANAVRRCYDLAIERREQVVA